MPDFDPDRKFTLLPETERNARVRSLSARLFVGKWEEHRDAAAFLDEAVRAHGEGVDTLVRALLLYKEYLAARERGEELDVMSADLRTLIAEEISRQLGGDNDE